MLSDIPPQTDPRVLVDFRTSDDAGVYAWESGPALVQTVDFFTPIVDDPYLYGQIAAANSLSDVYAMGGRPLTALAIAGFPEDGLDTETIRAIFKGGVDVLREAGVALLGGHTVRDREIKFGYAVTGAVDPARMWTNAGARVGDVLLLTKPIGTGIVGTAIKFGRAPEAVVAAAVQSMRTLNKAAAEALADRDGARLHRHHRLWPARPRLRDGGGERRRRRPRRRRRAAAPRGAAARRQQQVGRTQQQSRAFLAGRSRHHAGGRGPARPVLRPADIGRAAVVPFLPSRRADVVAAPRSGRRDTARIGRRFGQDDRDHHR